ncbi:MAG: hypothetical protein ACTSUQ_10405 [Candidatus Freyarchaeota archaeon]
MIQDFNFFWEEEGETLKEGRDTVIFELPLVGFETHGESANFGE